MFCRKCGKQINDQATYCSYCGAQNISNRSKSKHPVIDLSDHPTAKRHVLQRRWGIIIVASILVIVALLTITNINLDKDIVTIQEAQAQMNAALEDVYREASEGNYIIQALKGKVGITVESIRSTEDGCLAECKVTSVDIATAVLNYLLDLDEDTIDTYSNVVANLQKEITKAEKIQETFHVEFIKVDGDYKAILPEEMIVFCSGNIQELLPKLYEILQGGTIE